MAHGWTATKEALPPAGEKVLIISKWGHVSDGSLVAYDPKEAPLFLPDGLEPDVHVKWWMPMLENGWHTLKEQKPREGQEVLTKDSYGHIFSCVWKRLCGSEHPTFVPFVWVPRFWREMPPLPDGVKLNYGGGQE